MYEDAQEKKPGIRGILSKMYYFILLCIVSALLISQSGGGPRIIAGYGVFNVLTGSMESVIPKGSLVITKSIDPSAIEIGDDITFMNGPSTTITHRVIEIMEDVEEVVGSRAFITKGTENDSPDKTPVRPENIVGKVIWHNLALGKVLEFFQTYWISMIIYLLLFTAVYKGVILYLEKKQEVPISDTEENLEQSQSQMEEEKANASQEEQVDYQYYQQQNQLYMNACYEQERQLQYQQYIYEQQMYQAQQAQPIYQAQQIPQVQPIYQAQQDYQVVQPAPPEVPQEKPKGGEW